MNYIVPPDQFGKDHYSLLMYIETCCVDELGLIDKELPRGNTRLREYEWGADKHYPTILKGGIPHEEESHDDWDCLRDLQAAGLVGEVEDTDNGPAATLTDLGWKAAHILRRRRAEGQSIPDLDLTELEMA